VLSARLRPPHLPWLTGLSDRRCGGGAGPFHDGKSYEYLGVSPEENRDFMNAESRGAYLNQVIKPKYKCRQV
jgi:hypothetical protein